MHYIKVATSKTKPKIRKRFRKHAKKHAGDNYDSNSLFNSALFKGDFLQLIRNNDLLSPRIR